MSGIPSWAVPGAKVVCVDGGNPTSLGLKLAGGYPVTGGIYTIDGVLPKPENCCEPLLFLVELPDRTNNQNGWAISHFRPLVTRSLEQDVAEFRKLLDHIPEAVA